ncbi:MAG: hypothetical protein AB1589_32265 [Cyanobacteriota bacterium]
MANLQEIQFEEQPKNGLGAIKPGLVRNVPSDIPRRADYLIGIIKAKVENLSNDGLSLDKSVQEELANLINLLQSIEKRFIYNKIKGLKECDARQQQLEAKLDYIQVALESLLQKQPSVCLSKKIRQNIQYSIHESDNSIRGSWKNLCLNIIHLGSTPTKLIAGLVLALPLYMGIAFSSISALAYLSNFVESTLTNNSTSSSNERTKKTIAMSPDYFSTLVLLALVGSAGALGSVISILTRIEEYQNKEYEDSILPMVIGACKPLIGASFGILLFTLSCSTMSPLQISENANTENTRGFTFFSLAFIVGFSERFAKDIISRAESTVSKTSYPEESQSK